MSNAKFGRQKDHALRILCAKQRGCFENHRGSSADLAICRVPRLRQSFRQRMRDNVFLLGPDKELRRLRLPC